MEKEKKTTISKQQLETILEQIAQTRYGSVTVIVQDGKVIQVEKHEKIRLTK
ncbi:MAG: YezD family protein [Firmicutes bacterium]|nr:YezD family protein [Bacillota bacterium]